MPIYRNIIILLLLTVAVRLSPQATAQTEETVDLPALYEQIDEAISQSKQYVAERESQIAECRNSLLKEKNMEKRLAMAEQLFHLYKPYRNDSTLHYAKLCICLADSLRHPNDVGRFRSLLAYQCSNTNMYSESLELLSLVHRPSLDQAGLIDYYNARMHVYGELGSYTQNKDMRQLYFDRQNLYRDSVLMVVKEGSEEWYHLKMDILSARRLFQDALRLSDQWLKKVSVNTHEDAYAAFYRSMVYSQLRNHDMTCFWLGRSALADIKSAVMNQASLLFLAERLADDGDIARARRYMDFTRECNQTFSPQIRFYQFNSFLNILEKDCQAAKSDASRTFVVAIAVIVLLLIVFLAIIIRKKKKK